MNKKVLFVTLFLSLTLIFNIHCGGSPSAQNSPPSPSPTPPPAPPPPNPIPEEPCAKQTAVEAETCVKNSEFDLSCIFDFDHSEQGWQRDVADYLDGERERAEFRSPYIQLPVSSFIPEAQRTCSIKIEGKNPWDDLFMYMKRKISGLNPNQKYKIHFNIRFASSYPDNFSKINSPGGGENIFFKAGATQIEPMSSVVDPTRFVRMNINKGNQNGGGEDMMVNGNMVVKDIPPNQLCDKKQNCQFAFISKEMKFAMSKKTNDRGELWLIVGTESGNTSLNYETFYYDKIEVNFEKINE